MLRHRCQERGAAQLNQCGQSSRHGHWSPQSCRSRLPYLCRHPMIAVAVGHNQPEGDLGRCQLYWVLHIHIMLLMPACWHWCRGSLQSLVKTSLRPDFESDLGRCQSHGVLRAQHMPKMEHLVPLYSLPALITFLSSGCGSMNRGRARG